MNAHLEPAFLVLLPALEKAGIEYWVYGSVSIAAVAGEFKRENDDVDVFVIEEDFKKAREVLIGICGQKNNYEFQDGGSRGVNAKPKVKARIAGKEIFTIIPVYKKDDSVLFRYNPHNEEYSNGILKRVERSVSRYRFFTAADKYIKEIFLNHMKDRPEKMQKEKYRVDARILLTPKEYRELVSGQGSI